MNATLFLQLLLLVPAASAQPAVEGKWAGKATLADGAAVTLYLDVTRQDGRLKMVADLISTQPAFAMADVEDTDPSFSGTIWRWKLPDPYGGHALCEATLQEDGSAQGHCKAGELSAAVTLRRDDSNPWVAKEFEAVGISSQGARYLNAVAVAVQAFGNKDFKAFDELFAANTIGMQPNELYRAAFQVVALHGTIRKLEFVELDGESARLRMHLGETTRDFIVQLAEDGKIQELTYVPPAQRHLNEGRQDSGIRIPGLTSEPRALQQP